MKISPGLFLDLFGLKCLILIYSACATTTDVTETNNFLDVSDNSGICDILSLDVESEQCSFVLNNIDSDGDSEGGNDPTFTELEYIDGDRLLTYLKGKPDYVQSFLLKITTQNWDKLNGTEMSVEKLEILADFHRKKDYSEKIEMLSQDVRNGDILKLIFSKLEKPDEISSQLNRVMLSPSALVNSIRNREYTRYPADNDIDPEIILKDFVTGMSEKDERSLNMMTSLVLGLMNETAAHIEKDGLKIAENFMTTVLGIVRPISGGVEEELRMYITLLGNAAQEVSKGNWTALGDHVKAQFNQITIGQPGNLSQAVGGQGGPQIQAIAVALDIFIGFVDGIMKSSEIVNKIDSFIPLSFGEKFEEGIRAFLRYQPSQDIQILAGTKTGNNELAQFAAKFLEDNENTQALVLPSVHYSQSNCRKDITVKCVLLIFGLFCDKKCDQSFGMHQNSVVMLDNTTDVFLDRARPDNLERDLETESTIFCQPGNLEKTSMTESAITSNQYYCNNAFAVRRIEESVRGINIISLGDGVDTATGFKNTSNVFLVGAGHKTYYGGDESDAFVLTGGEFTGDLDGDGNLNTLVIGDQFGDGNGVLLDLINEKLNLIDASKKKRSITRLRNFHSIVGRTNRKEEIVCSCTTNFVNGRGGSTGLTGIDKIEIPRQDCSYNLHIVLNNHTVIENDAISGKFVYDVPFNTEHSMKISRDSLTSSDAEHLISFDYSLANMSFIRFDKTRNELIIGERGSSKNSAFTIRKLDPKSKSLFHLSPKFVTKFGKGTSTVEAEIRVSSEGSPLILHHLNNSDPTMTNTRVGFPGVKNIFMLQSGSWNVSGFGSENIFVLENETFQGILEGGNGNGSHNVLMLGKLEEEKNLIVNLLDGYIISDKFGIQNVQNVVGRANAADNIIAACTTKLINGRGGASNLEPDIVTIKVQDDCDINLRIIVHDATKVLNSATQGNFFYEIRSQGPIDVRTNYLPEGNVSHHFIHEFNSQDISNMTFRNGELLIEVTNATENSTKYNFSHKMKPLLLNSTEEFYSQPKIVTSDGVELKVASDGEIFGIIRAELSQTNHTRIQGVNLVRNIFYINSTDRKTPNKELRVRNEFVGGELDDLFILSGEAEEPRIIIDGGKGQDTLAIDSNFTSELTIKLDLNEEKYNPKSQTIQIRNVQIVHGRGQEKQDEVIVGCDTKYISGFEKIQIPQRNSCNYSLTLEIATTTIIMNNATRGDFNYKLRTLRSFDVDPTGSFSANHSYFLNLALVEIQQIVYDKIENNLKYKVAGKFYEHKLKALENGDLFHKKPRIFTSDKSELKVSRWGSIYVSQISGKRLGEILDIYPAVAERLNITISMETGDRAAVFVGNSHNKNILQNKINMPSHLIGQGSQNTFRIIATKHDVYIYPLEGATATAGGNILDMSDVIAPIRKQRKTMYSPLIAQDGEDIIFTFDEFRVILTNGRSWWQNLKVIYDVAVLDLKPEAEFDGSTNILERQKRSIHNQKWRVQQAPLILSEDAEIIILMTSDLEPGTEVQVGGHTLSANFEFIKMDKNLLLTNYGNRGSGGNLKTLVFTDCFDKSSNFLTDNISVNFTQEHLTYNLELAGKIVDFKTFSQVQTEVRARAFQQVYPEESKQNFPDGEIIAIGVAAAIVLGVFLIAALFIRRKRSRGLYVVSWIEGWCGYLQQQKQYNQKY